MDRLIEGLDFLTVGMGVVFVFLVLMVFAMIVSARVSAWLGKFFPEQLPEKKPVKGDDMALIAAAIAIAKSKEN